MISTTWLVPPVGAPGWQVIFGLGSLAAKRPVRSNNPYENPSNHRFRHNDPAVNGYDIGFYPDCSGSGAPLKWEMESYSAASGAIAAHVLRPTLSHTKNDTMGMFFGGAFNSFQSTAAAVWNTNYKRVWHLGDGTTLSAKDSTSNINNGTTANAPPSTSGKIDGAGSFTKSSNQYVVVPNVSSLNPTASITLSAWIYPTTATNDIGILSKSNWQASGYDLWQSASGSTVNPLFSLDYAGNHIGVTDPNNEAINQWIHVVGTYTKSEGVLRLYVNGSLVASSAANTNGLVANGHDLWIAGYQPIQGTRQYNGKLDEVRISSVARSADWILTEYRNQSAPGTYISAGPRIGGESRVRHVVTGGV